MEVVIDNLKIHYEDNGKGKNILILHGWGSSGEVFKLMSDYLKTNNRVIVVDLPGFGKSEEPNKALVLDDYVDIVKKIIKELKIVEPIIIGHSFGGRITIKLAADKKNKLKKIILIDSAGIRRKKKPSIKVKILKFLNRTVGKLLPSLSRKMKDRIGSSDYRNASLVMKDTLVNVVREDLTPLLEQIEASTLLIWGENDMDTPFEDALLMERLIKDSGIVKVSNAGHYSFLDDPHLVHLAINSFIKEEK